MHTWVRSLHRQFHSSFPRPARRRPLIVEALEDRCVPAAGFSQLDLVSDQANTALLTDAKLVDAWGIAVNPTSGNFWVADNRTNVATFYGGDVNGSPFVKGPLEVHIPFDAPSGAVFNGTNDFTLSGNSPAQFIVAQETAWAAAWNQSLQPATQALAVIDTAFSPHFYEGLAIAHNGNANLLYLTNITSGAIEVYNTNFQPVTLAGNFTDPNLPSGFAPFNIANIGGQLYVTYAMQNASLNGDQPGPGNGYVDVFNPDGSFVKRLISGGPRSPLNSPWGLAIAPAGFGGAGGDLLVGNFGDGRINVFDPSTGEFVGSLNDASGNPIAIDGLWGLQFGNGFTAGDTSALYFAAGPDGETHGLFGALRANGTNPLSGTTTAVTGSAGMPLPGVLATFNDATPGLTANDFDVTITINGQNSPGMLTPGGTGFLVTGPNTSPEAGTFPVTILIQEKATGGASLTLTGSATVAGNPLSLVGPANPQVTNPDEAPFTGPLVSFADSTVGVQGADFTATVAFGNGVTNEGTVTANGDGTFTVAGSNPSPEDGTFPSTVTVHDNANHSLVIPFTFVVSEPSLSGRGLAVSTGAGGNFNVVTVATFTHGSSVEPATAFTASIHWGDGAISPGTVAFGGDGYVVQGSHTYAASGTYTVSVTVSDDGIMGTFGTSATVMASGAASTTRGQRFVTQVFHDLMRQTIDAQTLQRLASEFDQGTSPRQVALDLAQSFGKSFHKVLRFVTGSGSTTKRAQQLFLHLLNHRATSKADVTLVRSVARKLAKLKTEAQALALLLSTPDYLAKIDS